MSSKPKKTPRAPHANEPVETKTEKPKSYQCIRCGFKADSIPRMQVHIDRKPPCKVSETGINVDLTQYRQQILDHTFETMLRCIFCNKFFDDKDLFIEHKQVCDKETLKKIPTDEAGKNYCERCHKAFKFRDPEHTIVCNETLEEYKKMEDEKYELEEEVRNLRMLNRKLNEELYKFVGIVNKCIDDYNQCANQCANEDDE